MNILDSMIDSDEFIFSVDQYVPLSFEKRLGHYNIVLLRYVSDYALVEIGVSAEDGSFASIRLVQSPAPATIALSLDGLKVKDGYPKFDVSAWQGKKLFDVKTPVHVALSESQVMLLLDSGSDVDTVFQGKGVKFGVGGKVLCWVVIEDLLKEQIDAVRESINSNMPGGFL